MVDGEIMRVREGHGSGQGMRRMTKAYIDIVEDTL
jgi:hypothetical protein